MLYYTTVLLTIMVGIHNKLYKNPSFISRLRKYCSNSTLNKSLFYCDDMFYSIQIVFTKLFTDIQRVTAFAFWDIGLDL